MATSVTYSTLAARTLETRVLTRYALVGPVTCRYAARSMNDTYLVTAGGSRYYLRLYTAGWRRRQDVCAEGDMLAYLATHGQPVSHPVRRRDGGYVTRVSAPEGTRWAMLFTDAPGQAPRWDLAKARDYGEIVGRMHACLDQRPVDRRRFHLDFAHLLEEPLRHIEPVLREWPSDMTYLAGVAADLRAAVESLLGRKPPEYGCCHGDHHGYNVHVDEHGRMTVFDFDCYGYGWRAYDVAVFLWQRSAENGWSWVGRARTTRQWNAFLGGYSRARVPSAGELAAAKLFVPVRHIWWLGLHTERRGAGVWPWHPFSEDFKDAQIRFIKEVIRGFRLL